MMRKQAKLRFETSKVWLFAFVIFFIACVSEQGKTMVNEDPLNTPSSEPTGESPSPEQPSEQPPMPELEKFIFKPDRFTDEIVPRNLNPAAVAKFLIDRIDADTALRPFIQAEKVAAFYETTEIAEKYKSFLNRNESGGEDIHRSIVIDRIIGRVGKREDIEFARQYYNYLASRVESVIEFEEIIELHDVLGLGGNSAALRQRIQAKLGSLESRKNSDYQARLEYLKFQESIEQKMTRAEKAEQFKEQILNTGDRNQRLKEEIKVYLSIDYGFLEYLQPWAASRIRRETWALQPAEQTVRNDKFPFKEDVAKAFRAFLEKPEHFADLPPEEKEAARISILRAIKFFGGKISQAETDFLELHKGTQADTLANEGFMLEK
jgi:hypothetical protein